MKYNFVLPLVAVIAMAASQKAAASTILFDNTAAFDVTFPSSTRYLVGGQSSAGITTSSSQLNLFAQKSTGESGTFARAFIYSTTDLAYDFLATSKTFSFNSASLVLSGGGSTYAAFLGVFSGNGNAVTAPGGPGDGIYFQIDRTANRVYLQLRLDAVQTTLATFTPTGNNFDDLTFTLSSTLWSASITQGSTVQSLDGTFSTPIDTGNWGSNFYIGLGASQTSSNEARSTQLNLSSITITNAVPEPSTVAMAALGLGIFAATRFLKKR